MPDAVMLFAAGLGTRMGALTATRPKPLIEVAGQTLLDHALDVADEAGVGTRVVNTHYLAGQIADALAGRHGISVSREVPDLLDTGGGLRQALPLLAESPVFTLNSDAVWTGPNPLTTLAAAWDGGRMDALLLLVPRERARGRLGPGDFSTDGEGRLQRTGPLVYTGAQILRTEGVARHPPGPFSLNEIWDEIGAAGKLFGTVHPGGWCDVGHPGGIAEAEAMLAGAGA
ncbi:MAG: nucleotidyltransferase family protein [Pseudomonadota bacterium]